MCSPRPSCASSNFLIRSNAASIAGPGSSRQSLGRGESASGRHASRGSTAVMEMSRALSPTRALSSTSACPNAGHPATIVPHVKHFEPSRQVQLVSKTSSAENNDFNSADVVVQVTPRKGLGRGSVGMLSFPGLGAPAQQIKARSAKPSEPPFAGRSFARGPARILRDCSRAGNRIERVSLLTAPSGCLREGRGTGRSQDRARCRGTRVAPYGRRRRG